MSDLDKILDAFHGSDLYMASGSIPLLRRNGKIHPIENHPPLTNDQCLEIKQTLLSYLTDQQKEAFFEEKNILFIYQRQDRYRVFLHEEENNKLKIHFHYIPLLLPSIEELGLPQNTIEIAKYTDGLILISGPMNSGRSTTANAFIKYWNQNKSLYILTLERLLEHPMASKKSLIHQKQISSAQQFNVYNIFQQNMDVCFLSDMYHSCDRKKVLDVCVGGCLVMTTTFATSAVNTIEQFLEGESALMARRLSTHLKAIIYQRLLPGKSGEPVLGTEILLSTQEIRKYIQNQDLAPIEDLIKKDQHTTGMISFNQSLMNLLIKRKIELRTAFSMSPNPQELDHLLKKVGI